MPAILFPKQALLGQVMAFVIVFTIERIIVYKNIALSFLAFEEALDVLRRLLPAYLADSLHFNFNIYNSKEAKETAANIEGAIEEILSEQSRMMNRYENLNSDLTYYVNAQQILLDITHEMISINDTSALYDLF
tara:strand:- start:578 stop:979 length:402 start_codon:yes stop_codon:yes gene_type:complete